MKLRATQLAAAQGQHVRIKNTNVQKQAKRLTKQGPTEVRDGRRASGKGRRNPSYVFLSFFHKKSGRSAARETGTPNIPTLEGDATQARALWARRVSLRKSATPPQPQHLVFFGVSPGCVGPTVQPVKDPPVCPCERGREGERERERERGAGLLHTKGKPGACCPPGWVVHVETTKTHDRAYIEKVFV